MRMAPQKRIRFRVSHILVMMAAVALALALGVKLLWAAKAICILAFSAWIIYLVGDRQ